MRAGWHCNPGAAYAAVGMSEADVAQQIRNHKCHMGSCTHQSALTEVHGIMAGAVRISLGYMTTYKDYDVYHFVMTWELYQSDNDIDFIIKEYVQ